MDSSPDSKLNSWDRALARGWNSDRYWEFVIWVMGQLRHDSVNSRAVWLEKAIADAGPVPNKYGKQVRALLEDNSPVKKTDNKK